MTDETNESEDSARASSKSFRPWQYLRYLFFFCFLAPCLASCLAVGLFKRPTRFNSNEQQAVSTLRSLCSAQKLHSQISTEARYGTLEDLEKYHLIDSVLATGIKHGYVFKIKLDSVHKRPNFSITTHPILPGRTGERSFFVDPSNIVRYSYDEQVNEDSFIWDR